MEGLRGKTSYEIDANDFGAMVACHTGAMLDIGTGDGRLVREYARAHPARLAVGIDACRENLREVSRKAPRNALYVIANALALPPELRAIRRLPPAGCMVTINFPWGSLLEGLLAGAPALLDGLAAMAPPGTRLELRLNAGALAEAGWELELGAAQIRRMLAPIARLSPAVRLDAGALRDTPTGWAKRLAFGRDPRGVVLHGVLEALQKWSSQQ